MKIDQATDGTKDELIYASCPDDGVTKCIELCPQCAETGDLGARNTFVEGEWCDVVMCEKHGCYWFLDLHDSDSSRQWEQASKSLAAKLAGMTEVKPSYFPETEQMRAARNCRRRLIAELGQLLSNDQQEIVIRQLCEMTCMVVEGDKLRYRDLGKLLF